MCTVSCNLTLKINPFIKRSIHGNIPLSGHIYHEQITNPQLDTDIMSMLKENKIECGVYTINKNDFHLYIKTIPYPVNYFGKANRKNHGFTEKLLEHFISIELLMPVKDKVIVDIGAGNSPFSSILNTYYSVKKAYPQDRIFNSESENIISGNASKLPFANNSIHGITLHCALEHFESNNDIDFIDEAARVLVPGGKCIILPLYLSSEYTINLDPVSNLLRRYTPDISSDYNATFRYCDSKQHFSRHYDVINFCSRLLNNPSLKVKILHVQNYKEIYSKSYLRFIAVFEKHLST